MDKDDDLFCEIIKDKLANYTLPVDDDSWDKIAEQLNPAPRKRIQWRWIAALAVAASIALLFLLLPMNKKTYHHEATSQFSGHEKTIVQDVPEKEILQPALQPNAENPPVIKKSQPHARLAENNLTTEVIPEEEIVEENPVVIFPEEKEPSAPEKHPIALNFHIDSGKETQEPASKHKNRKSIRFSFGSGGNLLADNTSSKDLAFSSEDYLNSGFAYYKVAAQNVANSLTEDILANENYSDVTYHLPLSFGVTIKKELNQRFAIESGIVYSFLMTTFNRESPLKSKANLQLHYIGIPLNIHTHIFGNRFSPLEVYLSAGGMIEKGILSHFTQKTYYSDIDNSEKTIASNEKIKGLQWSLGISPGVDYLIHKNYSIYLEPKVSYYFDNDQPISARTKHPVVVGINAGVRYTW